MDAQTQAEIQEAIDKGESISDAHVDALHADPDESEDQIDEEKYQNWVNTRGK